MKLKIAGFLCLVALVGALVFAHAQTSASSRALAAGSPGRYQLLTATIEKVVPEPQRVVLRIDSETGQVWMLSLRSNPAGSYPSLTWDPIQEGEIKPN